MYRNLHILIQNHHLSMVSATSLKMLHKLCKCGGCSYVYPVYSVIDDDSQHLNRCVFRISWLLFIWIKFNSIWFARTYIHTHWITFYAGIGKWFLSVCFMHIVLYLCVRTMQCILCKTIFLQVLFFTFDTQLSILLDAECISLRFHWPHWIIAHDHGD